MDKLKMRTPDLAGENFKKLSTMFPNAITETINENGEVVRAIDVDILQQEISGTIIAGGVERYQFTWPDKKKSIVLANKPINKTLRLDREKSVGRDGSQGSIDTENIYIEGDNLEALKLLQETYLGKVKMIYIDPPYNTGNDFIYNDDFSQKNEDYLANSGQSDEEGNRLVVNLESNGRFHTDWLNMIYPRLRLAKDLLSDDGVIFISIDDNEQENLKKICDEVFGARNFVAQLVWEKKKKGAFLSKNYINMKEYILVYAKHSVSFNGLIGEITNDEGTYPCIKTTNARGIRVIRKGTPSKYKELNYTIASGTRVSSGNMELIYLDDLIVENGILIRDVRIDSNWIYSQEALDGYSEQGLVYITQDNYIRRIVNEERVKMLKDLLSRIGSNGESLATYKFDNNLNNGGWGTNEDANDELHHLLDAQYVFDFSKPTRLLAKLIQSIGDKDCTVLDFFSGSASTADAVMKLNSSDGGKRKFIMVQLPEQTQKDEPAWKAGYFTICEIGEERIRRAGKTIKEEHPDANVDIGFRVFKVDSSNMKDVYYNPDSYVQEQIDLFADNIKEDRTPEDLLFQVMLDLGISLSSKIEESVINDKKVFIVGGEYTALDGSKRPHLIACFDKNITDDMVKAIAEKHPSYAVFRDSCMANDCVATNFEQIFETYSPNTVRKVL